MCVSLITKSKHISAYLTQTWRFCSFKVVEVYKSVTSHRTTCVFDKSYIHHMWSTRTDKLNGPRALALDWFILWNRNVNQYDCKPWFPHVMLQILFQASNIFILHGSSLFSQEDEDGQVYHFLFKYFPCDKYLNPWEWTITFFEKLGITTRLHTSFIMLGI